MSDRQTMSRPTGVSVNEPTLADQVMGREDESTHPHRVDRHDEATEPHAVEPEQERTQALATEDMPDRQRTQARDDHREHGPAQAPAPQPARVPQHHQDDAAELAAARQSERERRRAERERALGTRHKAEVIEDTEPASAPMRTTDKFLGSLGLFVLRLVAAVIMGLHGVAHLLDKAGTEQLLNSTIITTWIPRPELLSYILACGEIAIAVGLLLGALTRLAGLGTAIILILALVVKVWVTNPFQSGYSMVGETEVLLAAIGIVFLCVGGGAWGVDGALRRSRARSREENLG